MALQRLKEFLHFATLYKEAYREVKRISPQTRVFVSFQWEWMRILDEKEPGKIKEHTKVINIFRPELDVVGLTTYPSTFHDSPEDLREDYYSSIARHTRKTDRVLVMEAGWPTRGSGSQQEQADYIRRLPELLAETRVEILAWALLHDVSLPEFDANLRSVGLITGPGERKAGFGAFEELGESLASRSPP